MTLRKKLSALASSLVVGLTAYSITPFISTAGAGRASEWYGHKSQNRARAKILYR